MIMEMIPLFIIMFVVVAFCGRQVYILLKEDFKD